MPIPVAYVLGALGLGAVALRARAVMNEKQGGTAAKPGPALPTAPITLPPQNKPQVPPIVNHDDSPRLMPVPPEKPLPPPQVIDKTPGGNQIIAIQPTNPDTGALTLTSQIQMQGKAAPAAHALFDYLKVKGITSTAQLKTLTLAFQKAHNADQNANHLSGTLDEDGIYGPRTSAALTVYTGQPVAADPKIPVGKVTGGIGPAAIAASNLYAYLKVHKNDKSAALKPLVLAFQKAVNIDPSFPGPAMPWPEARIIKTKLAEDGAYGKGTADALTVATYDRINP